MATIKQKRVVKRILENRGMGVSTAMLEEGYSPNTAKNPKNLTSSNGWNELMEEFLPDKLLAQKHQEMLNVPRKIRRYKKGELETETVELNHEAVGKGLDMAYKLKGRYKNEAEAADSMKDLVSLNKTIVGIISQAKRKPHAREDARPANGSPVPEVHQAPGQPDVPAL